MSFNLPALIGQMHVMTTAFNGGQITVMRGAQSVTIPATFGRSNLQSSGGTGGTIESVSEDFIVLASDYAFGGAVAEPIPGDKITATKNGTTYGYELIDTPYTPSDPAGVRLRLHATMVTNQAQV